MWGFEHHDSMEDKVLAFTARLTEELATEMERAQGYENQIRAGVTAFVELGLRKMRDDAWSKVQRLRIKLEALEELLRS